MDKFGLYTADKTQINKTYDYNTSLTWKRTGMFFNGKRIEFTPVESNKLGTYVLDGKLMCNGYEVSDMQDGEPINIYGKSVRSGNVLITSENVCVNITIEDYNRLRAGFMVDGYSRYSEDTVYYIVQQGDTTVHYYDPELVAGHKDIIYNSFDNTLPENQLNDNTYNHPKDNPEIAVRYFESFYENDGQGVHVELEYYVDGAHYDSNTVYFDNENNTMVYGIGDTFTTIIEDAEGNVYKRTTYAG